MITITRFQMRLIFIPMIVLFLLAATPVAVKAVPSWEVTYWNNTTLTGPPAFTDFAGVINYDWGYGSPNARVQADYFSARWTQQRYLPWGRYRFTATSDDGIRVWVNGELILNSWYEHAAMTVSAEVTAGREGASEIVVEYFELTGVASVSVTWQWLGPDPIEPYTATVWAYHLNVRSGPGVRYPVVAVTSRGTTVTLTHRNADASWVRVGLPGGTHGWVNAYYLASNLKPFTFLPRWDEPYPPPPVATARVWAYYLNMRSGPSVRYYVVDVLVRNEVVELTGQRSGGWVQVRTQQGLIGWVNGYYLY